MTKLAIILTLLVAVAASCFVSALRNRRRVLIQQRWKISFDVVWCLVSVIFRSQKGLFALTCAALLSLFATYR
ncbi:hypothetical protein CR513_62137, partial [Mucuna pruriens]